MKKKLLLLILFLCPLIVNASPIKATEYIEKIAADAGGNKTSMEMIDDTGLFYDNTVDNNLRYAGVDPNNYIVFNNELWRIIGVFNNIDDGTGKKETRLKIVRDESIGNYAVSSESYGTNWEDSILMHLLNDGAYYNRTTGKYYFSYATPEAEVDFSNNGLTERYKSLIGNALWKLGNSIAVENASVMYGNEHSGLDINGNEETWIGKVGLYSASDFGFSVDTNNSESRNICLSNNLYDWGKAELKYCSLNSFLGKNDLYPESCRTAWVLSYRDNSVLRKHLLPQDNYSISNVIYWGTHQTDNKGIYPTVFLKSDVNILYGDGSIDNPYLVGYPNTVTLRLSKDRGSLLSLLNIKEEDIDEVFIDDNSIIKIDNNKIIPLKVGEAHVLCYSIDDYYILNIVVVDESVITNQTNADDYINKGNKNNLLTNPNTAYNITLLSICIIFLIFFTFIFLIRRNCNKNKDY